MDDDIRKWYNVGNLFSKKIHLFSSFHLRLSKEIRRLSPPYVSLLLLRVFNRIESMMDNCLGRKNVDLRQLKSFQNSLIQRASKVETSSLSLFYACATCHLVGMNEVEICHFLQFLKVLKQLKILCLIPFRIKYSMLTAKPPKLSVFRHIAFKKVLLSKYVKRSSEIEVLQSNQTVITQHAKRELTVWQHDSVFWSTKKSQNRSLVGESFDRYNFNCSLPESLQYF